MDRTTLYLVRAASIVLLLWFGYQLAATSVITIVRQQNEILSLQQQLAAKK